METLGTAAARKINSSPDFQYRIFPLRSAEYICGPVSRERAFNKGITCLVEEN